MQSDFFQSHGVTSISPGVASGHGLEESDWQQSDVKCDHSVLPQLISLDAVPPSSIAKEAPVEVSEESKHSFLDDVPPSLNARRRETFESTLTSVEDVPSSSVGRETPLEASEKSKLISADDVRQSSEGKEIPAQISANCKLVSLVDVLPLSSAVETPVQGLKENCITRAEEIWQKAMTDCEEICETRTAVTDCEEICKARTRSAIMTETAAETNSVSGDSGLQGSNLLDLGDAYKLAVGSRGRQLSGALAEQWIGKDSSRFSDDLKLLFSQLSAARELSINDSSPRVAMSPKLSVNSDELKNPVASSALGMQILQKRISLERNESGLSLDGSIVSEIEGESVVDRLKRQVEHDKKLLQALYKELEEERNASAIAANQAMAMITRLQEEKATLQMEALQYLRMMEEQAEYDMESLQKTNDLLTEKEKELQDLEAELEFYRNKFPSESLLEDPKEQNSDMKMKDGKEEHSEDSYVEVGSTTPGNSVTDKPDICNNVEGRNMCTGEKNTGAVKNSLLNFEDERSYILQCMENLEKKLCLYSNNQLELANGKQSGNIEERVKDFKELNSQLGYQVNSGAEENNLSTRNDRGNGSVHGRALSLEKSKLIGNEYNEIFYGGHTSPLPRQGIDLDSLAAEVSDLNERLKVLEADKNFLEHSINSIRNGEEGLRFIQEIASHLKELRRIGIRREQNIAQGFI
ncbi:hypothetical protein P3X46_008358 [Hevea brasiliensis]|nr:hypothetical protein P3X46_008358 [Hevea brasiliensis]